MLLGLFGLTLAAVLIAAVVVCLVIDAAAQHATMVREKNDHCR